MAKFTANIVRDNSSVANFKAWAQQIDTWLQAWGAVPTADTGQLGGNANWAAVAAVPGSGVLWYLIYTYTNGGATFYIKYYFGNSGTGANAPRFRITIGTASNGAGTLTSETSAFGTANEPAGSGATTFVCYCTYQAGLFAVAMWTTSTSSVSACFMGIEQTRDASGAVTTDGVIQVGIQSNTSATVRGNFCQALMFSGPTLSLLCNAFAMLFVNQTSQVVSSNTPLSPLYPLLLGQFGRPILMLALAGSADYSNTQQDSMTLLGSTHTYIFLQNDLFKMINASGTSAGNNIGGMIWE